MSLDFYLTKVMETEIFSANVTHNLTAMAEAVGIYKCLWRPEEVGITRASQMIAPLREALKKLEEKPEIYILYNPKNGWGTYEGFMEFVKAVLEACEKDPDAKIEVSR